MDKFKLDSKFLSPYKTKKPPFGFNGLGELVYSRTYSRIKPSGQNEVWWETVQRVVEGTYNMQRDWILQNTLYWDEQKAQESAQEMFDRIFSMKFLPPGRGLWAMGSPITEERGLFAALMNCFTGDTKVLLHDGAVASLEDLFSSPTHRQNGVWIRRPDGEVAKARVNHYGKKIVQEVELSPLGRTNVSIRYKATLDHRWKVLRANVSQHVTDLQVGDQIVVDPVKIYDETSVAYAEGFVHGLIFGDGAQHTYYPTRHELRICDGNEEYYSRYFDRLPSDVYRGIRPGTDSAPYPCATFVVPAGVNWKAVPTALMEQEGGVNYIVGFIHGWLSADSWTAPSSYKLDTINVVAARWLFDHAWYAGLSVTGWTVETKATNFDVEAGRAQRNYPLQRLTLRPSRVKYKVESLRKLVEEETYCLSVDGESDDDRMFVLAGGIPTGNCAFCSTQFIDKEDPTSPFCFLMDMSMLGVGVGFDTKGAGKVLIQDPDPDRAFSFTVPDSREGWVQSVRLLLRTFLEGEGLPEFDYSEIRQAGVPIKGFGGVSSGPAPLVELHDRIRALFEGRSAERLSVRDIVDVMNMIGACVIAGNVRRSAEIVFGDPDDEAYLDLKNYEWDPDLQEYTGPAADRIAWSWASNNSVFVEPGCDYSHLAEQTRVNGEPGYAWLHNMQNYGRMGDKPNKKDRRAMGGNPCFSGDTLIAMADGRGAVPIRQLAEEGNDVAVYSVDQDGVVSVKWGRNPRKTRDQAETVIVTFDDGSVLKVTPDHKMRLLDGTEVLAKDLEPGTSLPRFQKRQEQVKAGGQDYWRTTCDVRDPRVRTFEHRMIAEFFDPDGYAELYNAGKQNGWIQGGCVVHHCDYNGLNNSPDNLEWMAFEDHARLHSVSRIGAENGMFGKQHSDETKRLIGDRTRERCSNPAFLKKLAASHAEEERVRAAIRMSQDQRARLKEYYLEQERTTDLETVWVDDCLFAVKICPITGEEFVLPWRLRHQVFSSRSAMNKDESHRKARQAGILKSVEERQRRTLNNQVRVYTELTSTLGRSPKKSEWENACRDKSVPFRIRKSGTTVNPYALSKFSDLSNLVGQMNHKVVSVAPGECEDVYNLTVDDNYTVGIVLNVKDKSMDGIFTFQCLEQTLEHMEMCCLVEVFPHNCDDKEDFLRTLKFAYLYAKTVTLSRTHWPETNKVMLRNRRIGCSMSGIQQFIAKAGIGEFKAWCEEGYKTICQYDQTYSEWLAINESVKKTSVKPSGTVSIVAGATSGMHWPKGLFYIRRIRLSKGSELIPILQGLGYHIEPDKTQPDSTMVVSIPIKFDDLDGRLRTEDQVSMWEQVAMASFLQQYWADNQVSCTVTFRPEEGPDIQHALNYFQYSLKGISFLPYTPQGKYAQLPEEIISKERYEEEAAKVQPIQIGRIRQEQADTEADKYCTGGVCTVVLPGVKTKPEVEDE